MCTTFLEIIFFLYTILPFGHFPAFFPLEAGDYPVVFFLGGLNTYVLAELYTTVLSSIASHGFFVFGVDYQFPVYAQKLKPEKNNYGKQDIDKFFKELTWVKKKVVFNYPDVSIGLKLC